MKLTFDVSAFKLATLDTLPGWVILIAIFRPHKGNIKMSTKSFTATEVRDAARNYNGDTAAPLDMLRAFADMLEAQEKAVPVAWRQKHLAPDESQIGWILTETRPAHFYCEPLYTHPSPADAERLAEALRDDEHEWPASLNIRDTKLHDDMGGPGQRIYTTAGRGYKTMRYIRHDLAHSAQAQPPAASATKRERKGHTEWRQGTEKDGGGTTNYVEPVWVWDEPELFDQWMDRDWPLWRNDPDNPNVARLRRMYDTLAAQENPNG